MPPTVQQQRSAAEEVEYWLSYIDCATRHPHPLPSGKHVYQANLQCSAELRNMYHCLYKLYTEESSSVNFREPVNALSLGVFNYYDVVSSPMSLRTVLDKLVDSCDGNGNSATAAAAAAGASGAGRYTSAADVLRDVEQIWQNCARFNGPTSPLMAEAKKCAAALSRLQQSYADEQLAPQDEVDALVAAIEANADADMLKDIAAYFRRDDPSMMENDNDLDVSRLKVRHVRVMRGIVERYTNNNNSKKQRL